MDMIYEGDDVLLYLDERRTYLVRAGEGISFHTHKGYLQLGELIVKEFGTVIRSSLGAEFYAFKPLVRDYILKTKRRTQIMYPKDMGLLILLTGIGPGSRVVEAGTGSGALTSVLANFVRPNGRVYSYEIREEFLKGAESNLGRAGLSNYVELKLRDVTEGIDEENVDAVVLDLAVPWLVVPHAYRSLRGSGVLASFSPTIEQVMKTVEVLRAHSFAEVETIELIMRRMNIGENRTRPETLMIGHTGYITVARKVLAE
jgi:tRNA (adenine57-N1/adenine58-N1)-methyltransferase